MITPEAAAAAGGERLRRRADLARRRHRRGQRRRPRAGSYATALRAMEQPGRRPGSRASRSRSCCTRHNIRPARRVQGARRPLRRAAAAHPAAPVRARRGRLGRAAPDRRHSSAQLYDWLLAHGEDVLTGDSFFHLSAYGAGAARAEPVRRRPRGLPDRPGRRRVRLPVRDPRRVPRRQRPRRRAASPRSGGTSELFTTARAADRRARARRCALYDSCRGGCMAAKFFTGLPLDGPDPECVQGYGAAGLSKRPEPLPSRPATTPTAPRRRPVPCPSAAGRTGRRRAADRACDESPLAGFVPAAPRGSR